MFLKVKLILWIIETVIQSCAHTIALSCKKLLLFILGAYISYYVPGLKRQTTYFVSFMEFNIY